MEYMTINALCRVGRDLALLTVFILGGCKVIPGVHISSDGVSGKGASQSESVELIPITQDLIVEMQSEKSWIVQVASFANKSEAQQMQRALVSEGFNIFSKNLKIKGNDLHRLYIGPKLDNSSAQAIKQKVDSQFGTESIVLDSTEIDSSSSMSLRQQMDSYTYRVAPGDVLNITVWEHPELTIPQGAQRTPCEAGNVIHSDGTIYYPYVGKISVDGKDVTEIRDFIIKRLARYLEKPQVDVSVACFRSQRVFVSGAVLEPSMVAVTDVPLTLLDALNDRGGLAADADWRSVTLTATRDGEVTKQTLDLSALYQMGDLSQNRILRSNDLVHVPRNDALKVFVMGDVINAGTQRIDRNGLTLAEALNNVGGINEASASASGIFVLRASDSAPKIVDIYQLDASMGPMLILSTQFRLKPMDIVYVTSAPIARWNKVLNQLANTLNGIYQLNRVKNGY